jgi:hypothetical protein
MIASNVRGLVLGEKAFSPHAKAETEKQTNAQIKIEAFIMQLRFLGLKNQLLYRL